MDPGRTNATRKRSVPEIRVELPEMLSTERSRTPYNMNALTNFDFNMFVDDEIVYTPEVAPIHYQRVDYRPIELAGDVETNPGPTVMSKVNNDQQQVHEMRLENRKMLKELVKLKKDQQKHKNHIQRQIELEKRNRKLKREAMSGRYAQVDVAATLTKIKDDVISTLNSPPALAEMAKVGGYAAVNAACPGVGMAVAAAVNGPKITGALNKLGPSMDLLHNVLDSLKNTVEDFRNAFSLPTDCDIIGFLVSLASICQAVREKSSFMIAIHGANLARQLGLSIDTLMTLMPTFTETEVTFGENEQTERVGQSLVEDLVGYAKSLPQLMPFVGFLSFFVGTFITAVSGIVPSASEMAKHFTHVGRAATGFRAMRDLVNWVYSYFSEIYYTRLYGMTTEEYAFIHNFPKMESLYAAVRMIEQFDKRLIDSSAGIADQILTVSHELHEYVYKANKACARSSSYMLTGLINRIKCQIDHAETSPARCHTLREQPIAVHLYGHPGVGKSIGQKVLEARIFKDYIKGTGTPFESSSFPRRSKNDYWEGYVGQPIVVLDDFGNLRDSQNKPVEEYEEFMHMVNTSQYPLKMAELKSKGVTNFTSQFIIASSNLRHPEIKSLVDPGAVYRRFHIWAEVTIDPVMVLKLATTIWANLIIALTRKRLQKLKENQLRK